MVDRSIEEELKRECARLLRITALPDAERAPYSAGIAKLERRVDELRAACGMTLEDYVSGYQRAIGFEGMTMEAREATDYSQVGELTGAAAEAWARGDRDAMLAHFERARQVVAAARIEAKGVTA